LFPQTRDCQWFGIVDWGAGCSG